MTRTSRTRVAPGGPDPRSRIHRACIHLLWGTLLLASLGFVWWMYSDKGDSAIGLVESITTSLGIILAVSVAWMVHAAPSGRKMDVLDPDRR